MLIVVRRLKAKMLRQAQIPEETRVLYSNAPNHLSERDPLGSLLYHRLPMEEAKRIVCND
jgi:hypothetical protein